MFLVTGAIGTGKTTWVVDQLIQANEKNNDFKKAGDLDKVRTIYSNIYGLSVPHEPLPDDWRTTPKNSIIAIDECHKIEIYQPNRQRLHKDPRVVALNESRHSGHDIYFITQAPSFIHSHVRSLCNMHYHFHNPMGLPAATVYLWRHGNTTSPDSQGAKNLAEKNFIYQYKKDIQNNFKSVEEEANHHRKIQIPFKLIFWMGFPIILICIVAYLFFNGKAVKNLTGDSYRDSATSIKTLKNLDTTTAGIANQKPVVYDNLTPEQRADLEQRSKEQQQYDGPPGRNNTTTISYNVNDPYAVDNTNFQRAVVNYPDFAGCVEFNKTCTCYTQQATALKVEPAICKKGLKELPFNYFRENSNQQYAQTPTNGTGMTDMERQYSQSTNPMQTGKFS